MATEKRIDVYDIIKKQYGCQRVLEYQGCKYLQSGVSSRIRKVHYYKCCCVTCGKETVRSRSSITYGVNRKTDRCLYCRIPTPESMEKTFDNVARKTHASPHNKSTGIRHYSITYLSRCNKYHHLVKVVVKGRRYVVAEQIIEHNEVLTDFSAIANEVNTVMGKGGQQGFIQWYNNNTKRGDK